MIQILVSGCNGKMGQEVIETIDQFENCSLWGGFDKENTGRFPFTVYTSVEELVKNSEKPDVIIDFSIPIATFQMLTYAKEKHIPIVIATTGFSEEEKNKIMEFSKQIPVFQSANMSFDIFLMGKLLELAAKNLQNTDIEIIESHHNRKIDSPSGTALLLADKINEVLYIKHTYEFDRHLKKEKRSKNEIGFSSIRGGNIVGEHTVQFMGENETLSITHTSYSRKVFAEGALKAALFLVGQPNGFYSMEDIISL